MPGNWLPKFSFGVYSGLFFVSVCILGHEPDGSGGCKPCDKDWFREELSAASCTACSSLDAAFITLTTGSNSSSLCGEFSEHSTAFNAIFSGCFMLEKVDIST